MALFIIQILSMAILIQMAVAPGVPSLDEIRQLLNQKENLQKVLEVFAETKKNAIDGTKLAKKKIASYGKNKLPSDVKKVLDYIAETPQKAFEEMEPMLLEIQQMNKELEEESVAYRTIARPLFSIASGLKFYGMRALGFTVRSVGEVLQLFTSGAQKGADAYYEGKSAEESKKVNEVIGTMHQGLEKVKSFGDKIDGRGSKGLGKNLSRGESKTSADDGKAEAEPSSEGIEQKEAAHEASV